ncbi:hypothetical protein Pst134EA_017679 [Puccinia striiformis f. sp. tritici]|uniref:hypothetical protein n=1 Tax=Puccinia striiformis f. sp. tritici TaxID=168172 RepID=UPI0020076B63|nr:hypothetical protein Pst134EA_017679 [Puccinia striiformis f. sp. tritici]KAH9461371.1 hypothetical protein Pst134EA_017679 [Puccinia striiformis f. sp. tritici]
MQSVGGLIWRGSIVLSIAMMALISLNPSVVISTKTRSGAAKTPPPKSTKGAAGLTKGTPAGRLVRCGRMVADRNPDPLMNRGPFFCTDDQAKWLCIMPKCYTRQKKPVFPLFFKDCTDAAKRTGLTILAVHFQEMKDKTQIVVQGWEQIGNGKAADEPGLYSCKTTAGDRPFCNGCLYEGPNDQGLE